MTKKYPVTGNSRLYNFLYPHVMFFTRRFYREFKVTGFDKIPRNEAVILAPNHQNAFMDAIVLLVPAGWKWQLSYLVRASIFQSKPARKFFNNINMLPVYRKETDGAASLEKNDEVFENCVYILSNKRPLVLYPEATHNIKRRLIPLKKGVTRIAFAAEEQNNFNLHLKIFPIGIYYTNPRDFNERIFIQVGEPVNLADYADLYKESPAKAQLKIKFELEERLREKMIDIRNHEHYEDIEFLRELDNHEKGITDVEADFNNSKKVIAALEQKLHNDPHYFDVVKSTLPAYREKIKSLNFRDQLFASKIKQPSVFSLAMVLLLLSPVYLYGFIHHIIPVIIPLFVVKKIIKDPGFVSSIKVAGGMFFIGLFHFIYCMIFWSLTGSFIYTLLYFSSLLVSGEVAVWWQSRFNKWIALVRFAKFKKSAAYAEIQNMHDELADFVRNAMN